MGDLCRNVEVKNKKLVASIFFVGFNPLKYTACQKNKLYIAIYCRLRVSKVNELPEIHE